MLRQGRRLAGTRVVLYVRPSAGAPRAAFVSSRSVGGAVVRNRARRLLREAWRRVRLEVPAGWDAVLVARPGIGGAKAQEVTAEVAELLLAAGVIRR